MNRNLGPSPEGVQVCRAIAAACVLGLLVWVAGIWWWL